MRKFSLLLWLIALLGYTACSESDSKQDPPAPEKPGKVTLTDSTARPPVLQSDGGEASISITTTADWSASFTNLRCSDWISVSPTSGQAGTHVLTVKAQPNKSTDERNATLEVLCGADRLTVPFYQKEANALLITQKKVEMPAEGGRLDFAVKHNVQFEVKVEVPWITPSPLKSMEETALAFTVEMNESATPREGCIIVTGQGMADTLTVYQAGIKEFIKLTEREYVLPSEKNQIKVELKSNVDFDYTIVEGKEWIEESALRSISTHTLYFDIAENEAPDSREGKIVFTDKEKKELTDTVFVYQSYKGALVVAKSSYDLPDTGGEIWVEINHTDDFETLIEADWIQEVTLKAMQTTRKQFVIAENKDTDARSGRITFCDRKHGQSQVVTVNQAGEMDAQLQKEREALVAFYNALGGPNWTRQTNWCSDKPIEEWEGVATMYGHVYHLDLRSNNLTGQIPESLFELKGLKNLMLGENHLVGTLSPRFAELTDLKYLDLSYNNLEGNVPVEWVALTNLETCNLFENRLSGVFPKEIYAMPNFDNAFRRFVQVQQFGYGFIFPATEGMINIGENLFLHPDGYALEYRMKDLSVPTEKDMQKILREAYKALPDDYDFVYFICNAESMPCSFAGRSYRVKFNISGLGYDSFDVSADYGSAGRLKDAIIITSRSSIYSSGPLLHETFHYWGAMDIGQWRTNDEGPSVDYAHWGVSSVNGTVGGFDLSTLQRNVDGNPKKYRAGCSSVVQWGNPNPMTFSEAGMSNMYYPPLELYMMGLIPASEVEPIHVFTGVTAQTDMWDDGTFFAEGEQIVTIEDIIKKHGPRVPDYTQSQKNFRGLIVVITKDPVADIYWEQIIPDIKNQEKQGAPDGDRPNFYQATGGRATLTLSGVTRK